MCGIYGEWSREPHGGTAAEVTHRMTALMQRRGPDDQGTWSDGVRCQFGFRRLSILDLSVHGHQPMTSHDGRFVLAFNGEIYNYRELRCELTSAGVCFHSTGDTETLLHALIHWGTGALDKLNGMFAFAFYDTREQTLLLARDHAGIKPLLYAETSQGLIFASQFNQLVDHPWLQDARISQQALGLFLRLGHVPAPYGLCENTHALEAGTYLQISPVRAHQVSRYFTFPQRTVADLHGDEANEAVDAAVTNAVKRQLVSDVSVGCFLSGGIDSPLVAAKVADVHGAMPAFTIGTAGDRFDESAAARKYAKHLGHQLYLEHLTGDVALAMLEEVITATTEPLADISIIPTLFVARMAAEHVKVVLSGDGGDELFWGYAERFAAALRRREAFQQSRFIRRAKWLGKRILSAGGGDPFHSSLGVWYERKHSKLREPWLSRIFPRADLTSPEFGAFDFAGGSAEETAQWLRRNEFNVHLPMVLEKVDRASMHHSIEVRVPLLDREVIETAARVGWTSCLELRQERGKLPLRHALRKHLYYQTERKRGFTVSIGDWLRGPLRERFADTVLSRSHILGTPMNRRAVGQMFQQHQDQSANHGSGLWVIFVLCLWADRHFQRSVHVKAA